jgi:predicted ester cyclase
MATTTTSTDVVLAAIDAINRRDIPGLRACWSAGVQERFPTGECDGPDAIAAYFQAAFDAMPDLHLAIQGSAEQGESVFVRWHMTGHHTGAAWNGVAASGKRVELDGIDHFVVRDGEVVSNFVVFDQIQFGRSVGLMPPDGSAGDRALKAAFAARVKLAAKLRR